MSTTDTAEAILLVLKRVGKWTAIVVVSLLLLTVAGWLSLLGYEYAKNRPFQATAYHELALGNSQDEVLYALGDPSYMLVRAPVKDNEPWTRYAEVISTKEISPGKAFKDYQGWVFSSSDGKRLHIDFDAPNGRITGIACFSYGSYNCPPLFGLRDGSTEDDVRSALGVPAKEVLDGAVKRMHYPQFNVTAYLEKRRVHMLKVSKEAGLNGPAATGRQ
jgi:hypothetical protein